MTQLKRKYRKPRAAFRRELHQAMTENKALAMLTVETYTSWKHHKHIMHIWGMFRNPDYAAFRRDYSENLMGEHLTGRTDIWRSFYFADYPALYAYHTKIPESYAMGDALSVAYAVLRNKPTH